MSLPKKAFILAIILSMLGASGYVYFFYSRPNVPSVNVERITHRDLVAIVSASGTIQPKLSVNMSSSTMGRVTSLAVDEGDRVRTGEFLLQIDPESLQSAVTRGEAALEASESIQEQAKVGVDTAQVNLELAREKLARQQELWELRLISRETYDQAVAEVELRETEIRSREVEISTSAQRIRQEQAMLDSARYDLTQVTIQSPIDGIVTRRNIEEGETVVVGTMNNPGTVLLTIADFSIIEAEIEVDETDIPFVQLGQIAAITIDALPDQTFPGVVTEIGNSPIEASAASGSQAINFKVVVTLDTNVPGVRPGFTCTADITTATRLDVLAVPIQSTTVRNISPTEDEQEEVEGVLAVNQNRVEFVPIDTGIAGERYFEIVSGLNEDAMVITGPFNVARNLRHGDVVEINEDITREGRGRGTGPRGLLRRMRSN